MITIIAVVAPHIDSVSGEAKDLTLFSYSDILKGDLIVKGSREAAKPKPTDKRESWVDMVVGLGGRENLYILKDVDIAGKGRAVVFSVKVSAINPEGRDYEPDESKYPFFLQMVFDSGPEELSLKKRISLWYRSLRVQKIHNRRNIIYAFGNRMPKESIVNPYPGGAIISIGDDRDVGSMVRVTRSLDDDYKLAFGKEMEGKLKKVVIGFEGFGGKSEPHPVMVSRILLTAKDK